MMQNTKKRICTGYTSMRAVESSVSHGTLNPFDGWTNKFVFPPHDLRFLV
jgi:S-adenosylmethionine:tRNA ribosyltransferase-isomerase